MRRLSALFLAANLSLALWSCHSAPPTPEALAASQLQLDPGLPLPAQQEIRAWYAALPADLKRGITRSPEIVYTARNGQVYASVPAAARTGQVVRDLTGSFVRYANGETGAAYPEFPLGRPGLEAQGYTCNATDGPYFRSWSLTGYSGIASVLRVSEASLPAQIDGQLVAAYVYLGGQAERQSDVDAGLVFLNGQLRLFVGTSAGTYVESRAKLSLGTGYAARLAVSSPESYLFRVDLPARDGPSVLFNVPAAGANFAGSGMFLKRAATLASHALAHYDGTRKVAARNLASHAKGQLATFEDGRFVDRRFSAGRLDSAGCRWPDSRTVQVVGGSVNADDVTVDIDLSR